MRLCFLCLALFLTASAAVHAQPATAERVPAAETAFTSGLESYQRGEFAEAYRLFRRAATEFGFHERTTAAYLMAARAAFADGEIDAAVSSATTLTSSYPTSRYASGAQALLAAAAGAAVRPFDLGIALPVDGVDGYLGQAVFNGIRIAVDEHNARVDAGTSRRRVRMVFRESGGTGPGAEAAVRGALDAGADAIVGPLFSDEAMAAAAAAEAASVALVAPLATDENVSAQRRFVFQANPTFGARGRAMARYAVGRLGVRRVGVASETGSLGAEEGAAFAAQAREMGATVGFETSLAADDWADLDRRVGAAQLSNAQAVFLPTTGADAPEHAADALRALRALPSAPRPLGNTEWEGLTASRDLASRFGAVFTQDFFVAPGAAGAFGRRYRELSGLGPDRLALIGYDVTTFVLANLETDASTAATSLADRLRAAPRFQGAAHRFEFGGGQINEALFILGYRDGEAVLLE